MKPARIFLLVGGLFIFSFSSLVYGGVPQMINYQGKLTTPAGALIDDTLSIVFTIYDAATNGGVFWTETQGTVIVEKGIFTVLLGSVNPIPDSVFTGAVRYLGVKVEADPEMTPRKEIVSVGYAYKAEYSDTAEYSFYGAPDDDWDLDTAGINVYRLTGNVGIGTPTPEEKLDLAGTAQVTGFKMPTSASDGYVLTSDASGLGTWQPAAGGIGGSGTANYVPKFTASTTLGNSAMYETGSRVGIGTEYPEFTLSLINDGGIIAKGTFGAGATLATSGPGTRFIWYPRKAAVRGGAVAGDQWDDLNTGPYSAAFGYSNKASGDAATVVGGSFNTASGSHATVPGGNANTAAGDISFASGYNVNITTDADYTFAFGRDFTTSTPNAVIFHNSVDPIKVGIGTTSPSYPLQVASTSSSAGYFTSNYLSSDTRVIHSEFTGSGNYDATAVYAKSRPADHFGYGGYFEGGYMGVSGEVSPTGSGTYLGVQGYVFGGSGRNYGLYGDARGSGTNYGVYGYASGTGTNWAGYFWGNAHVMGTLSKGAGSFKIDHPLDPENKYLFHSFVESPDMMNVYNGNVILDATGEATVELPAYFEALNMDFRYQLTCIGGFAPVYIAQKVSGNQFTIAGGDPGMEVSWQVTGIRHDKFAEANRIQVEVDKPADEQGKYLHPQAYKLGEEYDIHYEQHKRMKERETREMK